MRGDERPAFGRSPQRLHRRGRVDHDLIDHASHSAGDALNGFNSFRIEGTTARASVLQCDAILSIHRLANFGPRRQVVHRNTQLIKPALAVAVCVQPASDAACVLLHVIDGYVHRQPPHEVRPASETDGTEPRLIEPVQLRVVVTRVVELLECERIEFVNREAVGAQQLRCVTTFAPCVGSGCADRAPRVAKVARAQEEGSELGEARDRYPQQRAQVLVEGDALGKLLQRLRADALIVAHERRHRVIHQFLLAWVGTLLARFVDQHLKLRVGIPFARLLISLGRRDLAYVFAEDAVVFSAAGGLPDVAMQHLVHVLRVEASLAFVILDVTNDGAHLRLQRSSAQGLHKRRAHVAFEILKARRIEVDGVCVRAVR